ncbi:PTS sugar transporter subunit IIA [Xylocopilactobacillus apis]|uniref:Ascorbate-specific PTS system EIIA component n=1 Tax=Xylocopilactobacillus apis TaxID=2932183 RepID=A0AAU9D1M8_9LACO|nr:PTS sugar transporter subunit IIA [Xylocopilactobacillus apis]BDR57433.1 hypothetical protein KIMC2_19950 [Xylocopilactobacillus apis]
MGSVLPKENIQIINNISDWQSAIKKASEPLLDQGAITEQYVKNMIESVYKNGLYMVLTDKFALMHAKPGEGVIKQAMSMLVSEQDIDLAGKPVKIFLVLAAKASNSHIKALQEIVDILMDSRKFSIILSGNREKIISLFNKKLED